MSSLNKVMLIGRLTRDPQIRHTPKGTALAEFGLAVNRSFTTDSGEKREDTTFVDVSVWGKTSETVGKYLHKGNLAYIEGRLRMETWTDKNSGPNRSRLTIVGETVQFLEPAGSSRQNSYHGEKPAPRSAVATPASSTAADDDWDEPFSSSPPLPTPLPATHENPTHPFPKPTHLSPRRSSRIHRHRV